MASKGMVRGVAVVLAAIGLSVVLATLAGSFLASDFDSQLMRGVVADDSAGKPIDHERARAVWGTLARAHFRVTWIYGPAIVVIVEVFVGLMSRRRAWQLGLAGTAPYAIMFSVGCEGAVSELPLLCLYLALGAGSAWSTSVVLHRLRSAHTV